MCEEDVPGYGGMEAAETKEMADSWRGCEHGGATKCWFLYLYYCGLWICLYLYYLRLCGSTAWQPVRLLVNDRKFPVENSVFLSHQTSQQ